ncbi:hypothetical protein [Flavobacterium litorale]|uniref:FecR protein domain-containing protein n=1 Tax=Flavobacterium litorale TaxID=2856519 RepID=A0ABX8V458_9FLAO|nr:hypothetical protein [Flavobacterium litorale]QYJ67277.1 hypothetical protein K1I41_06775 [Flavobacterium litorale]
MNQITLLYSLKQKILEKYRKHYPYYTGTIQDFGNKEIAQLLDLVEQECQERVSEKWVYMHLKPESNEKLPRKDMLNIFCQWLGYSGWDEFAYKNKEAKSKDSVVKSVTVSKKTNTRKKVYLLIGLLVVLVVISIQFGMASKNEVTLCFKDKYTQKTIAPSRITVYSISKQAKNKLKSIDSCYTIKTDKTQVHIVIESPYYKTDTITIPSNNTTYEYDVQPDDYAMMLRAYMNANVSDWKRRKQQLEAILHDDAVIQEVMFDDIGVEFLNKVDFINKITTPSKLVKDMEVLEIEYNGNKIIALKYIKK